MIQMIQWWRSPDLPAHADTAVASLPREIIGEILQAIGGRDPDTSEGGNSSPHKGAIDGDN